MSYLVLARKFRPQTFAALIGQEHISRALANSILRDRVPHALLFTGPRGVGKTSSARVFARALNCTGRSAESAADGEEMQAVEPCGSCTNCVEIARSSSLAVWEIDGASNNSVDNVRDLIDSLRSLPPPGSEYKVYIIDEVHMLSVAAFNALLKSLEEPPPNTIFIFATTEPHKIPDTVISRCQRHDFRRISERAIAEHLEVIAGQEGAEVESDVFAFVARRAQGGMRDAQSMFDRLISFGDDKITLDAAQRVFGVLDHSFFSALSEKIFQQDTHACFSLIHKAFLQSLDVRTFLGDFLEHWRNLLLLSFQSESANANAVMEEVLRLTSAERKELLAQLENQERFDVQRLFDIAQETVSHAHSSSYPRFVLEAGIAKMSTLASLRPLPELLSTLKGSPAGMGNVGGGRAQAASSAKPSGSGAHEITSKAPTAAPTVKRSISSSQADEVKKTLEAAEVEVETSAKASQFNPSWQAFIAHVRTRRMPMLEALLRRVSPLQFLDGTLLAEASEFDKNSLVDPDTNKALTNCLQTYSGTEQWSIRFQEPKAGAVASKGSPLSGSVAAQEAAKIKQGRLKIEKEARNDPSVKSVLDTFSGSKIEKVQPLRK